MFAPYTVDPATPRPERPRDRDDEAAAFRDALTAFVEAFARRHLRRLTLNQATAILRDATVAIEGKNRP